MSYSPNFRSDFLPRDTFRKDATDLARKICNECSRPELIQFPDPRTGRPQRITPDEAAALIDMTFANEDED